MKWNRIKVSKSLLAGKFLAEAGFFCCIEYI